MEVDLNDEQKLTLVETLKQHSLDFLNKFAKDIAESYSDEEQQTQASSNDNEESARTGGLRHYLDNGLDLLKGFFTKESCAEVTQKVEQIKFLNDDIYPNLSYINHKNETKVIVLDVNFWTCQH